MSSSEEEVRNQNEYIMRRNELRNTENDEKEEKNTKGRTMLRSWLNKNLRIIMTDGRILIGSFLCTDSKANVILGMCSEFTKDSMDERILGLVMVPGRHIVNILKKNSNFSW
ncbi:unnamed protein product, partial [Diamesa serratosioi]